MAPGTKMYLTGGATAVLEGWRESTADIDVRFEPDSDAALNRIAEIKERLAVNVELASPLDFDPYSQALSKLERGFKLDLDDVRNMVRSGQVEPERQK